jgi:DNA-binding MarR family transcriptional regulator
LLLTNIADSIEAKNRMNKSIIDLIIELKKGCMKNEEHIRTRCNISFAEYKGIIEIDIEERMTCSALAKKMRLSSSRGSRIIDNLVRKGYLLRIVSPADRRSFVVSLSFKGAKIRKKIMQEKNDCEKRINKSVSEKEMELIKEGLELITKVFK